MGDSGGGDAGNVRNRSGPVTPIGFLIAGNGFKPCAIWLPQTEAPPYCGISAASGGTGRPLRSRGVDVDPGIVPGTAAVMFSMAFNWIYIAIGFGFLRFLGQGSMMMTCANLVSMVRSKNGDGAGFDVPRFPISRPHPPLAQWLIGQVDGVNHGFGWVLQLGLAPLPC